MELKKYLLAGRLSQILLLAACGETEHTTEEETDDAETEEVEDTAEAEETTEGEESNEDETIEINEVITDDDQMYIELVNIEHTFDEMWDEERINIIFEVENKTETSKEVQPRSLSIDDKMVDEMIYSMSQEAAAEKAAQAVLTLEDYENNNLPELTGNLEMEITVFDWDDMDAEDLSYDVNINLEDY